MPSQKSNNILLTHRKADLIKLKIKTICLTKKAALTREKIKTIHLIKKLFWNGY